MQNFSNQKTTFSLALSFLLAAQSYAGTNVLVIDEGVDLSHPALAPRALVDTAEASGKAGVDDDNNGFVDDVAGWNNISNDGEFFPSRVKTVFDTNKDKIAGLFALYSRIEQGDMTAIPELRQDPLASRLLSALLSVSHGTHVGGIITQQYQKATPFLQSFNVFTSSKSDQEESSLNEPSSTKMKGMFASKMSRPFMKQLATILVGEDSALIAENQTPPSIFDDINNFSTVLGNMATESGAKAERLRQYMRVHPQGVVNLSLGFSKRLYMDSLNQLWANELNRRGLPEGTTRSPAQEAVLQAVADKIVDINKDFYGRTFAEFSNTLFVVAAGNDADPSAPQQGNNDLLPVWPANFSKELKNVITVAAVDKNGVITDFSNFGQSSVNVAAPGKAIISTAPGGLEVAMSGTSMSAPYVTGLAARLRTLNPRLTAADTRLILEKTGKRLPTLSGKCTTGSAVDPDAAAQAAIAAKDMDVDQAIEMSVKSRAFFTGKAFIVNNILPMVNGFKRQSETTPKFVRDMIRSVFYK